MATPTTTAPSNTLVNKNIITPDSYTGLDTLPKQIVTKLQKRGFTLNLLLVGKSGLGKSTLLNSIFASHLSESSVKHFESAKTTEITVKSHYIVENQVQVKLSVVDTPGMFICGAYTWICVAYSIFVFYTVNLS